MTREKIVRKIYRERKIPYGKIAIYAVLIIYTLFLLFPISTLVITSFVPTDQLATTDKFIWWPEKLTLEGYESIFVNDYALDNTPDSVWEGMPLLLKGFVNTLWITLVPLICGLMVSGLSAYAYSKLKFKGRERLFKFSFIISSVPLGAFVLISYMFYSNMGWTELGKEFLPLFIPGLFGSVSVTFFLRTFFDGISNGLLEAAEIDGMNMFQIYFRIIIPLAKPAFISQFIFGFVGGYNAYAAPLLYLVNSGSDFATLQMVLADLNSTFKDMGQENIKCAIAVMGMLPLIIIYIVCQKYFIEGISMGGIKE